MSASTRRDRPFVPGLPGLKRRGVGSIPFGAGAALRGPFDAISGAGQTLADAGTSLGMTIDQFSLMAGVFVALISHHSRRRPVGADPVQA